MNAHKVRIEPASLSVEPGQETSCTIRVTNTGDVVDAFDIGLLGAVEGWSAVEPATLSLFPGAEGAARLTFRPPRGPEVLAGPTPFGVRVQSQTAGLATSAVEEGTIEVGRFDELAGELAPRTSHARLAGRHQVRLTNRGNAPVEVQLTGSDPEQALELVLPAEPVPVWPGGTTAVGMKARVANVSWTGQPHSWSFKVVGQAREAAVELQGTVEQLPLLGRWTKRALAAGAIVLVAAGVLHWRGAELRSAAASGLAALTGSRAAQQAANGVPAGAASPAAAIPSPGPSAGAGGPSGAGVGPGGAGPRTGSSAGAVVPAATCAANSVTYAAPNPAVAIPGLSASFDNGGVARVALVEISANLGIDVDAEVRVAYSVDGGPAQENAYGPANLANHQEYYEARAVTAVIPLGGGQHSITPFWRISGAPGKTAYLDKRCLTVKSVLASPPSSSPVVAGATCAGNQVSTTATSGATPFPGLAVTVDNGGTARQALVDVTANLGVDVDAELRLAYSVDGGPAQENAYGPANLANTQQYYEGRDATAVIPLGAGRHTITAYWRVSGAAGKNAIADKRCLTVESVAAGGGGPAVAATCPGNAISTSQAAGTTPFPGLTVTVDDGGSSRTAVVTASANLGIDVDAELRLAYSVDGGPVQENAYGPANFANHQEYYETRAATAVIPLGPGSHTITAFWRISGAPGKMAYADKRCLTVESY